LTRYKPDFASYSTVLVFLRISRSLSKIRVSQFRASSILSSPVASRDRVISLPTRVLPYTGFTFAKPDSIHRRARRSIYILYIYTNAPNRIQLSVAIFWAVHLRHGLVLIYYISFLVSRSGKLTFNTCFAIYRIHLRRAQIYYIYSLYIQSGSEIVVSPDQVKSLLTRASPYTEFTFDAPQVLYIILIYITSRCSFHLHTPILLGTFYESSFGYESSFIQSRLQYIGYIYLIF
jgi:hypothetical protein